MTLIADEAEKLRELDEDTQRAWSAYRDRLRELSGEEYERAEDESWQALQRELRQVDRRRRTLGPSDDDSV